MLSKLKKGLTQFILALQEARKARAEFYIKNHGGGWEWYKN